MADNEPAQRSAAREDSDTAGADSSGLDSPALDSPGVDCPVVAIGASAGGVQALTRFFSAMPENSGAAFVVVLHLSPSHESHLAEVLQRVTALEVIVVEERAALRPDCIYVIAPNSVLGITETGLEAKRPASVMEQRHPIDALFASLAERRGRRAICVVLSGSGSNGSAGAVKVREREGLVLVQDPETAEHEGMPRNVILAGLADRVLAPEAMPSLLVGYLHDSLPLIDDSDEAVGRAESDLDTILSVLRTQGAHDFSPYKKTTLVRRILRRVGLSQSEGLAAYAETLRSDPEEIRRLIGDLLISVTGFFRDPEAWRALAETVIAPLVAERHDGETIRAWVPACSTGEEAYSVAMLLLEQVEASGKAIEVKVFATDPAPQSLARARVGLFSDMVAEPMPPRLLERFFTREGDFYRAKKLLREAVLFAPHNLLADPPFSRLDLVTCRNLLIYLTPEAQDRIVRLLHFALREGGALFLGAAESIGRHAELFEPLTKTWRLYTRIGETRHDLLALAPLSGLAAAAPGAATEPPARGLTAEAREALAGVYAPPAALIDERNNVLFLHGDLEPYLTPPPGEPTTDLVSLVREPLRSRLRAALRLSTKRGQAVSAEIGPGWGGKAPIAEAVAEEAGEGPGDPARLWLTVTPVAGRARAGRRLVGFELRKPGPPRGRDDPAVALDRHSGDELEDELWSTREELRLSIEGHESSTEDLRAANEEITSINEELQLTNEELESSKEELQSLNEELNTVNVELQMKVEELEQRTNDLDNLLNSTEIGTLFLDREMKIRWFTPPLCALFDVIPSDVGRPITNFASRFTDARFLDDAAAVLETLETREAEVPSGEGRWYLRRILPYRTEERQVDGLVVTFVDITGRKLREEELTAARTFAERIVDTTHQPFLVLDAALAVRSANRAFYEVFEMTAEQVEGRPLFELDGGDWDIPALRAALTGADAERRELGISHSFRGLGLRDLLIRVRKVDQEALTLLAIEDVTGLREAAQRDVLLSELNHRIKNLLTKVQAIIRLSQGSGGTVSDYASQLLERVSAIARSEELTLAGSDGIGLRELVAIETEACSSRIRPSVEGPEVRLATHSAQIFALIIHELSTNAIKYGAFSRPGGALHISWSVAEGQALPDGPSGPSGPAGQTLSFAWIESGVPIAAPPSGNFGSRLIIDLAPGMLGAVTRWEATPDGVHCRIEMPLPPAPRKRLGG